MELTLFQSTKVFFSYAWRGSLLTILITILMGLGIHLIFGSGAKFDGSGSSIFESFLTGFSRKIA